VGGESTGEKNECDNDEADERADEKAEDESKTVLFTAKVLDQTDNALWESRKPWSTHCQKLTNVFPVAQGVKSVSDPDVVGHGFNERKLLHQIFVRQRIVALIIRILDTL